MGSVREQSALNNTTTTCTPIGLGRLRREDVFAVIIFIIFIANERQLADAEHV